MITEKLLQFIWKFKYFNTQQLQTVQGETVQIVQVGTHNLNQGPDFLNAKIKIDNTLLVGNIELHVHATDWYKHKHQGDVHYNNIILHVVWEHNIVANKIYEYPVLELKNYVSKVMLEKYETLMDKYSFIPCEKQISTITSLQFNNWKDRLLLERLEQKTDAILVSLEKNKRDWEETFWQKIARNFGIKVNADAFEDMALHTPHIILAKNKLSQVKLESLLLGQAGMLTGKYSDEYVVMLQKEYDFLKSKYKLQQAELKPQYLRMRPYGFPTIRLSQLAALVFQSSKLFSQIMECKTYKEVMLFFKVQANDYWNYHYKLDDDQTSYKEKHLGEDMVHNIIINTIVPVIFAYGIFKNEETYKQRAILFLESIPTEENNITKGFRNIMIKSKTAADSQALIHLKNNYCSAKKCLDCAVGNAILKEIH
jgi:hypothetical protein